MSLPVQDDLLSTGKYADRALTLKLPLTVQHVLSYTKGNSSHSEIMSCSVQSLALLLHSWGGGEKSLKLHYRQVTTKYFTISLLD